MTSPVIPPTAASILAGLRAGTDDANKAELRAALNRAASA